MSETKTTAKKMPKGGRKGGAVFPRMNLETAVGYAKRLVAKTHSGPQTKDIIYSGVLDAKGGAGNVKLSALKQYGFSIGNNENGFAASEPAKLLASAPPEEIKSHCIAAVLRPKVFKALFDTFHGDTVTLGKLKQRAAALNVHPEQTESCISIYLESAQLAGLVTPVGDSFRHVADSHAKVEALKQDDEAGQVENERGKAGEPETVQEPEQARTDTALAEQKSNGGDSVDSGSSPRAIFNVNVTLDSSLDTDKLQKQLELLKKFGAI